MMLLQLGTNFSHRYAVILSFGLSPEFSGSGHLPVLMVLSVLSILMLPIYFFYLIRALDPTKIINQLLSRYVSQAVVFTHCDQVAVFVQQGLSFCSTSFQSSCKRRSFLLHELLVERREASEAQFCRDLRQTATCCLIDRSDNGDLLEGGAKGRQSCRLSLRRRYCDTILYNL